MADNAKARRVQDATSEATQAHDFGRVLDELQLDDLNADTLACLEALATPNRHSDTHVSRAETGPRKVEALDEPPVVLVDAKSFAPSEDESAGGWGAPVSPPAPLRTAEIEALLEGEKRKYAPALADGITVRYDPDSQGNLRARYFRLTHEVELIGCSTSAHRLYHHEMAHHLQHVDAKAAQALRDAVAASSFVHLRRGKYPGADLRPHLDEMVCDAIADFQTNPNVFRGYFPKLAAVIVEKVSCKKR